MKLSRLLWLAASVVALYPPFGLKAQTQRQLTTTLLPMESPQTEGPNGLLWVQENPVKQATVKFDLNALPPGLQLSDFVRCTLRLVAKEVQFQNGQPNTGGQPVIVKVRITGSPATSSIASLSPVSTKADKQVARQASDDLRREVFQAYSSANKVISLTLFTGSHKASTVFYSFDPAYSNVPRLVIEYTLPPPSLLDTLGWGQRQQNPEHTGRSRWLPFYRPTGFEIVKIPPPQDAKGKLNIADYPLIYQGRIYLIYMADRNYLTCLDFTGKNVLWQKDIGTGAVERSPVISPQGVLYADIADRICAYDLNRAGERFASPYTLAGKLSNFTDLTVGNDGSIFLGLSESNVNFIYGFTPRLVPFLKSSPFEKTISTIAVSPEGNRIFAQMSKGAVVIDITNPSDQETLPLAEAWEYYHVPLAGPSGGVMIFSDFTGTSNQGTVWGYASSEIWKFAGKLTPQPVMGSNGFVYFLEDGKLLRHKYDQVGPSETVARGGLKTTSNLVMDGADNVYFWNEGKLYAYKPGGGDPFAVGTTSLPLPERKAIGPEKFIRLMMAPDGTLWANNKGENSLYSFQPTYAKSDQTVGQNDLASQTVYRATGKLSVAEGGVVLKAGTTTFLQGGTGIRFSSGFRVELGASLLCRAGR